MPGAYRRSRSRSSPALVAVLAALLLACLLSVGEPLSARPDEPAGGQPPDSETRGARRKATWVWNTRALLDDAGRRRELAEFLRGNGFDTVFLQLPGCAPAKEERGMERLVRLLAEHGMEVQALDGCREYALPERHDDALRAVERVLAYNRTAPRDARLSGVHLDVEPYLLPCYRGARREWVMTQYLSLLEKAAALAREGGLRLGADIPFWFDSVDECTGRLPMLAFEGRRKLLSEHVIDLVDDVAIMDYRTKAEGSDGIVAHARGELSYAARRSVRVFIGLEVTPMGAASEKVSFSGLGRGALEEAMKRTAAQVESYPSFAGFAIHHSESYRAFLARYE